MYARFTHWRWSQCQPPRYIQENSAARFPIRRRLLRGTNRPDTEKSAGVSLRRRNPFTSLFRLRVLGAKLSEYLGVIRDLWLAYSPLQLARLNPPEASGTFPSSAVLLALLLLVGFAGSKLGRAVKCSGFLPRRRTAICDCRFRRRRAPGFRQHSSEFGHRQHQRSYSIHLQLSLLGRQSIELLAPAGGLQIEARRDVNAPGTMPLTSSWLPAWFNKPVAILLNNGHGAFLQSRARQPFLRLSAPPEVGWSAGARLKFLDALDLAPQSQDGIFLGDRNAQRFRFLAPSAPFSRLIRLRAPSQASYAGRAPPTQLFFL